MSEPTKSVSSRRDFLKTSGGIAAASTLAGIAVPHVHAGEQNTINVVLIGCGGRGTGAAVNALGMGEGQVKLVAMADVFDRNLSTKLQSLNGRHPELVDVPEDRQFIGFDAYKKAMDCLKPGDVAILGTPPAFRWVHFKYAIEKNLNVFMEKPVTVDGPTTRRMIELAAEADRKNLKVGVGLMVRHCRGRQALKERIENGEIGEIISMRGYRMSNKSPKAYCGPKAAVGAGMSELLYQIAHFHSFLWASGGVFSDYIHQIDELSWMKNAWPVHAQALGGRHYRGDAVDQNLDTYSVEYTYPDGTKMFYCGRNMNGCHNEFSSFVHGTKGSAIVSTNSHAPGRVRTFKDQNVDASRVDYDAPNTLWAYPQPETSPYDLEWVDLIDAIRRDIPYNEVKRGAEASMVASMGRMAAHTGQVITFDQMLNCEHEFAPGLETLTMDGPAPLKADADGVYPVPAPGIIKDREYPA